MLMNTPDYKNVVSSIKAQIKTAQYRAVSHANRELILLYWNIGRVLLENGAWGNKFIENLARDIKADFPALTGFSVRNLKYMKKFAAEFPDGELVQQLVALIPWGHLVLLLDRIKSPEERQWYLHKSAENGWSRSVLQHQIDLRLYERQALTEKTSNFEQLLPPPQSDLVRQAMKDPYIFDFIEAREDLRERDIEEGGAGQKHHQAPSGAGHLDKSMAALHKAQDAFAGEAKRLGLKDEADVVRLVDEVRDEQR